MKIKILYCITDLEVGGTELVLLRLLGGLNKEEFEPIVVSMKSSGILVEKIKKLGIKVFNLNFKGKINLIPFFKFIKILRKEKPLILQSFLFHADILGRIGGKICKTNIIISSIRSDNFSKIRRIILKTTHNMCDLVVCVSKLAGQKAIENKIIPESKIKIIPNGIDVCQFNKSDERILDKIRKDINKKPKDKIFISVGNLREAKGYKYLIEATEIIKSQYHNILVIILGEGSDRSMLEQEIKNRKLGNNILLIGRKMNVSDYLAIADFFVLPSLWEGMPNALLEAMAAKLICIATNVSGVVEVVKDGQNGFLTIPGDSNNLAHKMIDVLNISEANSRVIKESAYQTIINEFSNEKMVNEYQNTYYQLIRSKNIKL
ncbi:MAG: glycosyltransferase [Candidatus Paceibacterota bacterium]|jgi:glycosyltransferase involved in cell wall biosynthesis